MCFAAVNSDPERGKEGEEYNSLTVGQNVEVVSDLSCDRFHKGWTGEVWCFEDEEGTMMAAVKLLKRPDGAPAPIGHFDWFLARSDCLRQAA